MNKKSYFTFFHFFLNLILILGSVILVLINFRVIQDATHLSAFFHFGRPTFSGPFGLLFLFVAIIQISLLVTGNQWAILRRLPIRLVLKSFAKAFLVSILITYTMLFLLKIEISRGAVFYILLCAYMTVFVAFIALVKLVNFLRQHGRNQHYILLVGQAHDVEKCLKRVQNAALPGVSVVGYLAPSLEEDSIGDLGVPCFGTCEKASELFQSQDITIDEVMVLSAICSTEVSRLLDVCDILGKTVKVASIPESLAIRKISVSNFFGTPTLTYSDRHAQDLVVLFKGLFDLIMSSVLLVLFFPVFIITAILIKFQSRGPVFFSQTRIGLHGRKFTLYKFRTMVLDAEKMLDELKSRNEGIGYGFKIKNDPRIFPFGKFLRKYSLDELPQLFNVLKGEMSMVGPRPSLPNEVKQYDIYQLKRLSMKPGLTCLWQVSNDRKDLDFDALIKGDLEYIDRWSFYLDFLILVKTVKVVVMGTGH